jgi:phage terminase small subunit
MALTEKQRRFVEEYLIDLNATQAAIRAGYSVNRASEIGYQLLQKTTVSKAISEAMAERSKRTGINADRVLQELARIAFVNPTNVIDTDDATVKYDANDDDLAAIQSVKVKSIPTKNGEGIEREIRFNDKIRALELLGKHLGMFKDKLEINGSMDVVQIIDDIPRSDENEH